MKTQIKNIGTSKGIILSPEFLKFKEMNVGDWVDISDMVKINKGGNQNETNNKELA